MDSRPPMPKLIKVRVQMMTSHALCRTATLALAVLGLAFVCRAVQAEADLLERFRSEAPRAWSRMEQLAKHIDMQVERTATTKRGRLKTVWAVKWNDDNLAGIGKDVFTPATGDGEPTYRELAFCRNSKYAFELRKDAPDQTWFVDNYSQNLREADNNMLHQIRLPAIPLFALVVFGKFLPDWYREETFSIKHVDWDEQPSRRRVAVKFEYQWPAGKTHKYAYWPRSGTLFLRPDLLWSIEEFQVEMVDDVDSSKKEFHWSQENALKELSDGFPAVVMATQSANSVTEGRVETTWTFTRFEQTVVPERQFTLSAFGLPEIGGSPSWGRGWWIVLNAVAILCILLGIVIRRQSRIRNSRNDALIGNGPQPEAGL